MNKASPPPSPPLGVVAIGRNEGERLRLCLQSALAAARCVVYVDSGSTDGSVDLAKSLGAVVVELDLSIPFTAARARNEGFDRLLQINPQIQFVQFVDGDCQIVGGWPAAAEAALRGDEKLAVACGRRRERFPDASIYNRLCDIEWNTPVGIASACGGDSMMRVAALKQVGGFNPGIIAGEEPELCFRLRQAGWTIRRLDCEMTLHDADMKHLRQWRKRAVRYGHACAEGAALHGKSEEKFCVRQIRSIWFWGLIGPILTAISLCLGWRFHWLWILTGVLALAYPLLTARIYISKRGAGLDKGAAALYSVFVVLSKFSEARGAALYWRRRIRGRRPTIIEYKGKSVDHDV